MFFSRCSFQSTSKACVYLTFPRHDLRVIGTRYFRFRICFKNQVCGFVKNSDFFFSYVYGSVLILGKVFILSCVFSSLQILKILQHKSIRGLSLVSFELEVIGYTIALAYCLHTGMPFSAYGELAFLLIQGSSPLNNCLKNSLLPLSRSSLKLHHLFSR